MRNNNCYLEIGHDSNKAMLWAYFPSKGFQTYKASRLRGHDDLLSMRSEEWYAAGRYCPFTERISCAFNVAFPLTECEQRAIIKTLYRTWPNAVAFSPKGEVL